MQSLPDIRSWRSDVDPEYAEKRVRWLREQILDADLAIEAQQRIIAADGPLDAYLTSIASLRSSQQAMESTLAEVMRQREVEVLDFALAGRPYDTHRASAKNLAIFLEAIQRLFNRVGQALSTSRVMPAVPQPIRTLCQLEIAGFYPSSFGIRFAARTNADLTGSSLSSEAMEAMFDLVNSEQPLEQAARLGNYVMTNYRQLVKTMVTVEATPKVHWTSPTGNERSWIADRNRLAVIANRLAQIRNDEPRTLQATGTLTGASLRRHKFEFNSDFGLLTGTAPHELANKVTAYFGKRCLITYVETVAFDEATEQEKRSRILLDVDPA